MSGGCRSVRLPSQPGCPLNSSKATERADSAKRAKSNGDSPDPPDPEIDPATRRQLEDRIAEISRENALLEKVAPTYFSHFGFSDALIVPFPFPSSVSRRRYLTTNSPKCPIKIFLPICKTCVPHSIACRQNMLAPPVGRRASARRYKRGMIFNKRETARHKSSEAQRPGWALLVTDAVSPVPNRSHSFISFDVS
jgi:hypothetical protein